MDDDDERASDGFPGVTADGDGSGAGVEAAAGADAGAEVGGSRLARMLISAEMSSMSISDWARLAVCGASVRAAIV